MQYVTITGKSYEDAVKKARKKYGAALRVHSRKDITVRGGLLWLGKRKLVEISCYLVDTPKNPASENPDDLLKEFEREAQTPDPRTIKDSRLSTEDKKSGGGIVTPVAETDALLTHVRNLLESNDFSSSYIDQALVEVKRQILAAGKQSTTQKDVEVFLVSYIVSTITIDRMSQTKPLKNMVLLGPTGVGKTTTIAKLAALFGVVPTPLHRKETAIITLDSFRAGAWEQILAFAEALGIPAYKARDEQELFTTIEETRDKDLLLIDTIGKSPRDSELAIKLTTLLSVLDSGQTGFYLCIGASMKKVDIEDALHQAGSFPVRSIIVTKLDETKTIGNVISLAMQKQLALSFATDGQKISDIQTVSHAFLLQHLRGFSTTLDMAGLSQLTAIPSL